MIDPGEALTLFDASPYRTTAKLLRERFVVPPFSVLETANGHWQTRKRNWLSLGIESELGRDARTFHMREWAEATDDVTYGNLTDVSIFDPVLCELVYRWWSPAGGTVLDPFAGGSVRGVVAAILGRRYHGIELSERQVVANREQADRILPGIADAAVWPAWTVGDSLAVPFPADGVDLVFTCPPYGDLEVYSDDPRDLSAMGADRFEAVYRGIIARAANALRRDRFAVFVVGNYRDPRTTWQRDLAALTVAAFADTGMGYYCDLALVSPVGSGARRASATFDGGRKTIRRHQYVLVFVKGDWRRAAAAAERMADR